MFSKKYCSYIFKLITNSRCFMMMWNEMNQYVNPARREISTFLTPSPRNPPTVANLSFSQLLFSFQVPFLPSFCRSRYNCDCRVQSQDIYIQNPYLIPKLRYLFSCTCFWTNNFSVAISTCYLSDPDPSPHCTLSIIYQSTWSQHSNITFGVCLHLLSISGVKI